MGKSNQPRGNFASCSSFGGMNISDARRENVVGSRILEARKAAGMTQQALSKALESCGLQISYKGIQKWEAGETVPNAYQMMALCRVLGMEDAVDSLSPALNEAGRKKLAEYFDDLIATGRYTDNQRSDYTDEEIIQLPVYLLPVSAGTGTFLDDSNYEVVSIPRSSVPAGAVLGIRVSGDSMEPVYKDGQIVWVERCETLRPGEVGIFVYDGEGYVKVYGEQEPEDSLKEAFTDSYGVVRKQPVLISYNTHYPPRAVSPEASFYCVGRVLGC